ncbi:MAG: sigma-54 dependent transcriptional regulator [Gemmatimonadaceae bacterium]|nr:sigma-54 dependent transcriptional regulator [Gemmatimonadaceae bacterium]
MSASVLVIDDEPVVRETLAEFFATVGYDVETAATAESGRARAAARLPDVVLVDLRLPDGDGLALLDALRADDEDVAVIVLTGHADVPTAVRAMQRGAVDLLQKPIDLEALDAAVRRAMETVRLRREVALLRARERGDHDAGTLTATALQPSFEKLVELAARNDDAPVLILGETGTGKGWVARRIHDESRRAAQPFVEVNGASLSSTFLESELFGHERGAFTDAKQAKRGLLEVASAGSVFLDEVGELSLEVQPKLLKVIEEQRYRRLGGTSELRSAARVICATHRHLPDAVNAGSFRADLYYRLQVLTITLPPLRARRDAIPALAAGLLPRGATLAASATERLIGYAWPGNIRELKNTLWRAAILAEGAPIEPIHLGLPVVAGATSQDDGSIMTLEAAEQRAISAALKATGNNRSAAAALLGISRSTLYQKLKAEPPRSTS